MKIKKEISDKVLIIGPFYKGKGGIATVVDTLSGYYETFYYVASTRSNNLLGKFCCFIACI
ncbi:MAG: hypothetical protein LBE13_02225, partial [Bacteroidales bacterium]|nr:hypothetical protein [Bacteroidales bacterium]